MYHQCICHTNALAVLILASPLPCLTFALYYDLYIMHSYTAVMKMLINILKQLFKLPGLIRCEPPADYVSSLHLPYPCDCLNLSLSSDLSHFCIVVWPVAIL